MAVAGFASDDLTIEVRENTLTVKGEKTEDLEENKEVLHRGIASRAFERRCLDEVETFLEKHAR